ncbi:hypothetical protein PP993_gp29 [Gordonia phage Mayweather]|uniref:LtfC/p132/Gp6 beta-sandwich domain-containing protein n=1 Tax=Gordonia phage Mayweather TaxID=2590931 RepID=A0A516KU20_9CAUD|nr:hypothetical protein PP993_gp29 [Gordonia phage Mayweather]QDP45191.1 hypothetical protein SEA_MAYWEATHER_29 [Gordonia phage Mayweather]
MALGYDPNEETLILSEGSEFVTSLTERGVQWPTGTTCTLEFIEPPTPVGPYTATVNETAAAGGTASFLIPRTDTTAAKLPKKTKWRIYLTKNGVRYLWFRGQVERQD